MVPRLSIAIPTYGSPEHVTANVKRLLAYERHDVEIVVVDNDETGELLKSTMLQIKDPRFHYYQNEENIGRCNNVAKAVERAASDNVLLLSSDDELFLDGVDEIMALLEKGTPYGVMLATIVTDTNGYGFDPKTPGVYKAGSDALRIIPFLGNLMPIVFNRKYLDFNDLYGKNEQYMQLRMALIVAQKGDLIYLHHVLGRMRSETHDYINADAMLYEGYFNGSYTAEKWDVRSGGILQYSPEGRLVQLKNYLEIIENCCERRDHKIQVIEKWVISLMAKSLMAIPMYMSPFTIKTDGYMGHLHYRDVLETFENEMLLFFRDREDRGEYFFSGHLHDLINNELLLITQGKNILQNIVQADKVIIYDNGKRQKNLQCVLECMGINSKSLNECNEIDGGLILIDAEANAKLEQELLQKGASKVLFMDRMTKYLTIVWCSEHEGEEYCKEYIAYLE